MMSASFDRQYRSLLGCVLTQGDEEVNQRTGARIKVLPGAQGLKVSLSSGRLPVAGNRRYFPRVAAAETAWELSGTRDPEFIMRHAPKVWGKFVEDGVVKAAYGHRWRRHFGRDQLSMAIAALRNDPSNRQVYVSAWDPAHDGLGAPNQPANLPCPVGFSLTTSPDGRLHMAVTMRSSDVFVGLPYDVMGYALKLNALAMELGRRPGFLAMLLCHAHLYETHWAMAEKSLELDFPWATEPAMPSTGATSILTGMNEYVESLPRTTGPDYNPRPEVVK